MQEYIFAWLLQRRTVQNESLCPTLLAVTCAIFPHKLAHEITKPTPDF